MRALVSLQCGPGSNPGVNATRGLTLLLVLSLEHSERFFSGYSSFPLSLLSNSENREHLKNFRNVDCVLANHNKVQDM